jgi:hypothetical protein
MRFRLALSLILVTAAVSSCTPAFSVRLYNRSAGDIVVKWKDSHEVVVPKAKDQIVGSAYDWDGKSIVTVKTDQTSLTYDRIRGFWDLPREAMRTMPFPAAGGSRECCLEFGGDYRVYVLHSKSLQRLNPQPVGFPITPTEVKKTPNQAPEPTPTTVTPPAGQEARQP